MKRALKSKKEELYYYENDKKIVGIPKTITGNIPAGLWGNISGLRGEVSAGLRGHISELTGDISGLWGHISAGLWGHISAGLRGDISELTGHISGLTGNIPAGLTGNVDDCEITKEERVKGINIKDLIEK